MSFMNTGWTCEICHNESFYICEKGLECNTCGRLILINGTAEIVLTRADLVKIAYALDRTYSTEDLDPLALELYEVVSELDDMDDWDMGE